MDNVGLCCSIASMSRSVADIEERIQELKDILDSGATEVNRDGVTTKFRSADEINLRIKQLEKEKDEIADDEPVTAYRPVSFGNGGNW